MIFSGEVFKEKDVGKILYTSLVAPVDAIILAIFYAILSRILGDKDSITWLDEMQRAYVSFDDTELIIIAVLIIAIGSYLKYRVNNAHINLANDLRFRLAGQRAKKFFFQEYSSIAEKHSSLISKYIISDVDELTKYYILPVIKTPSSFVSIISIVGVSLYLQFVATITAFSVISVSYLFIIIVNRYEILALSRYRNNANEGRFFVLQEAANMMRLIKFERSESVVVELFQKHSRRLSVATSKIDILSSRPKYLLEGIVIISILITLSVSQVTTLSGSAISIEGLAMIAVSALKVLPHIQTVYASYTNYRYGKKILDDFSKLDINEFALCDSSEEQLKPIAPVTSNKMLSLSMNNVSFGYSDEKLVVEGVSLRFCPNVLNVVHGESGSGKSTLLDLLLGLRVPISGNIFIDKSDSVLSYPLKDLSRYIAYCPQVVRLADDTILSNIISDGTFDIERYAKIKKRLNIHNLDDDFIVGENGELLSGGQRQRIALARAIYSDRPILVLDEATSALDESNEAIVIDLLKTIKNRIVIVVSHSGQFILAADNLINMGKINES